MCSAAVGNSHHPRSSRKWTRPASCREGARIKTGQLLGSDFSLLSPALLDGADPSSRGRFRLGAAGGGSLARSLFSTTKAPFLVFTCSCLLPGNRPFPPPPLQGRSGLPPGLKLICLFGCSTQAAKVGNSLNSFSPPPLLCKGSDEISNRDAKKTGELGPARLVMLFHLFLEFITITIINVIFVHRGN